jgi:hypothetical protein
MSSLDSLSEHVRHSPRKPLHHSQPRIMIWIYFRNTQAMYFLAFHEHAQSTHHILEPDARKVRHIREREQAWINTVHVQVHEYDIDSLLEIIQCFPGSLRRVLSDRGGGHDFVIVVEEVRKVVSCISLQSHIRSKQDRIAAIAHRRFVRTGKLSHRGEGVRRTKSEMSHVPEELGDMDGTERSVSASM